MANAYLGLGSNRGDREAFLDAAINALKLLPDTVFVAQSPIYETPPMGPQDQGRYLNMAVWLDCEFGPSWLIGELQHIEKQFGREAPDQRRHWGPRTIDIDLLLYEGEVIATPDLTLPHPGMHERWFVLKPLADIAPDARHPVLDKPVTQLLAELEDAGVPQGVAL